MGRDRKRRSNLKQPPATFGPLMAISLQMSELRLAGELTREKFLPLLEAYVSHGPSPDALEGLLMSVPEDWVAAFIAVRRGGREGS